jgi:hypothetical protein
MSFWSLCGYAGVMVSATLGLTGAAETEIAMAVGVVSMLVFSAVLLSTGIRRPVV